jgi:ATP-dependent DNA helicase RecG
MDYEVVQIGAEEVYKMLAISEGHFSDHKAIEISPANITKTVSAFANAAGGEIYLGIEEIIGDLGVPTTNWRGFAKPEDANGLIQAIESLSPLGNHYSVQFLSNEDQNGLVVLLTVRKTSNIIYATDGRAYVRKGAQKLPVIGDQALNRLKSDKGIISFEDEFVTENVDSLANSIVALEFMIDTVPNTEPIVFLNKQNLVRDNRPTVAGVLLFHDNPQAALPKRSAVKILQYKTKKEGDRDTLSFTPLTMEGPIYHLIYDTVARCKSIVETIEKLGALNLDTISYPEEALHEVVTNAILHRDYSIPVDIQIRIYDNRIEIESPGKFPGHVTEKNFLETQFARNPKLVRLVNKFPEPPNKDVGEGLNTTFQAMERLRLKPPIIEERDSSIVVILRHEPLDSPEQLVMEYLKLHDEISNLKARELTGIKSENSMKNVFYRLREKSLLEQVPGRAGRNSSWRKPVS